MGPESSTDTYKPEYTGKSVNYYRVKVSNPTNPRDAYEAECNDIIEALNMTFAEGEAFKAIWRMAAARQGKIKKGYTDGVYDAEKVEFYGKRLVIIANSKRVNAQNDIERFFES